VGVSPYLIEGVGVVLASEWLAFSQARRHAGCVWRVALNTDYDRVSTDGETVAGYQTTA
jgi:hypothetical protein